HIAVFTDTLKCCHFLILLTQLALSFPNDKVKGKGCNDRSPLARLTFGWLSSRIYKCYNATLAEDEIRLLPDEVQTRNLSVYDILIDKHWGDLLRPHLASILYAAFLNVTFVSMRISSSLMLNAIVLYMEGKTSSYKGYMYVISIFLLNLISSLVLRHSE